MTESEKQLRATLLDVACGGIERREQAIANVIAEFKRLEAMVEEASGSSNEDYQITPRVKWDMYANGDTLTWHEGETVPRVVKAL